MLGPVPLSDWPKPYILFYAVSSPSLTCWANVSLPEDVNWRQTESNDLLNTPMHNVATTANKNVTANKNNKEEITKDKDKPKRPLSASIYYAKDAIKKARIASPGTPRKELVSWGRPGASRDVVLTLHRAQGRPVTRQDIAARV